MLYILKIYQTYTTNEVIDEVMKGLDKGFKDVLTIKKTVEKKEIEVIKFKDDIAEYDSLGLHRGELIVIILAKKINAERIIIDDYSAIKVAKYFGLKPLSTPFVLLDAVKEGHIDKKQFYNALNGLVSFNYQISPYSIYKDL